MKFCVLLILFTLPILSIAEEDIKIESYITSIKINNTLHKSNQSYSKEIYNKNGKKISEIYNAISLDSSRNQIHFFHYFGNTKNSISGWIENTDSTFTIDIWDSLKSTHLILDKKRDTFQLKKVFWQNSIIVLDSCLLGCDYTSKFYNNPKTLLLDSIYRIYKETNWNKGKNIWKYYISYDDKQRKISERTFDGENKIFMEFRLEYNNKNHSVKEYFVQPAYPTNNYPYELTFFDKNKIPKKKIIYIVDDEKNYTYTIEYKKVK